MYEPSCRVSLNPLDLIKLFKWKHAYRKAHPHEFKPIGTMIFCSLPEQRQGSGKTLCAVDYIINTLKAYPFCILCTNVDIEDYPINAYYEVIEGKTIIRDIETNEVITSEDIVAGRFKKVCIRFDGLDCLKAVKNGEYGVIFFMDEIQLYMNSLDSKNIPMEIMTELSQQRKQRIAIVGTSQVFMRIAKPTREQIFDVVICKNFFKCFQWNEVINPATAQEKDGKLICSIKKRYFFFHSPKMYTRYDTYSKVDLLKDHWQGLTLDAVQFYNNDNLKFKGTRLKK